MKLSLLYSLIFAAVVSALANQEDVGDESTTTTSQVKTTAWITLTTKGYTTTIPTLYSQTFPSAYGDGDTSAASGEIGLGSLSGTVGVVRTYDQTTIDNAAGSLGVYGGAFGALVIAAGLLI